LSDLILPTNRFARFLLPGLAFKAVIIGGGYATGRELAEFFMPSGAWGGVLGMAVAAAIWSLVCVLTFLFARRFQARDYRSFFQALLGKAWWIFEIPYFLFLIIILAVFGAAAGAIGQTLLGLPPLAGTLALVGLIALFTAFGDTSVEGLFKYVSLLLYAVYAAFLILALTRFGPKIAEAFSDRTIGPGWAGAGLTYAGYNLVGAVAILPVLRHLRSDRDAVIAGTLAGPLAMLPAVIFFVCMAAWPETASLTLPSDFLLNRLDMPPLRWLFQAMIFAALLESGTGSIHAVNQRIASVRPLTRPLRMACSLTLLVIAVFLADRIGLVRLIASGYRMLAWAFLAVYVLPLLTVGVWKLAR
jgi:uncharacterized membrane protein YkvI